MEILRNTCGPDFKLVTPGIRPIGSDFGDQRRVMTPAAAIRSGSDYLVIGRPITQAEIQQKCFVQLIHLFRNMTDSTLVYSTEVGRIKEQKQPVQRPKGDGVVRIQKQTSGRKGAGVSVITGLYLADDELKKLAAELKKRCGCGGSVKDGNIEIQRRKT